MAFSMEFSRRAREQYDALKANSDAVEAGRQAKGKEKSSKDEGLFKQVNKTLLLLRDNPRHPGLNTHEFDSITHPFDPKQKVWESYIQNRTPGAYRIFWCYGPKQATITIIAITPHP